MILPALPGTTGPSLNAWNPWEISGRVWLSATHAPSGWAYFLAKMGTSVNAATETAITLTGRRTGRYRRADLPAIGPDTIRQAAAAGLRGIAVEAGGSLVLDAPEVASLADTLGLFVFGVTDA